MLHTTYQHQVMRVHGLLGAHLDWSAPWSNCGMPCYRASDCMYVLEAQPEKIWGQRTEKYLIACIPSCLVCVQTGLAELQTLRQTLEAQHPQPLLKMHSTDTAIKEQSAALQQQQNKLAELHKVLLLDPVHPCSLLPVTVIYFADVQSCGYADALQGAFAFTTVCCSLSCSWQKSPTVQTLVHIFSGNDLLCLFAPALWCKAHPLVLHQCTTSLVLARTEHSTVASDCQY